MLPGIHTIAPVPVKKPEKCCKQIIPISFNVSALALGQSYNSEILKYIAGLVQERHNSIANALELRLSCPNPSIYSVSPLYRGRVYRGIGYIAVACWTPFFWRPRVRYFSRNRGNTLDPIRRRQFFAKSAHRDSLCSRFAGDNFSRSQLWPTCQYGLEHMLCDGQLRSAEH